MNDLLTDCNACMAHFVAESSRLVAAIDKVPGLERQFRPSKLLASYFESFHLGGHRRVV